MARIPAFMLRHKIGLAAYLGVWGAYGGIVTDIACQIQEKMSSAPSEAGAVRLVTMTIVAQLDTQVTEGALVYLPDGRVGFVSAVAHHSAPGLPVPEHVEIAVELGAKPVPPALGGELVVILRRIRGDLDRYNNRRYVTETVEVPGAAVRPLASTESTGSSLGAGRDQTIDTVEVIFPPGTEITSNDRMRIRGLVYEVDGTPTDLHDSMTGADPGVKAIGKRVKG